MSHIDIQGFAAAAESVALRLDSARLPGLLRRSMTVPEGSVALVHDEDGRELVLRAGQEQGGAFTGILVKEGEAAVPFQLASLATKEGMSAVAGLEVVIVVPPRAIELKELTNTLLRDRDRLDVADIRAYLMPFLRQAISLFVASHTAQELVTHDLRAALEAKVREDLKPACFSAGLDLRDVRHPSFFCEEYDRMRAKELEAKAREEEVKQGERLQELRARLERNEVLKKAEVEELAKVLQYEGVLKEISLKTELDRKRKEDELRRYEALHQRLGQDDVKALVFLLEDEKLRAELIRTLAVRDMTEEQIRATRSSEVERKMDERLNELSQRLNMLAGVREKRISERGTRTRRVYGAYGQTVVGFDPGTNFERAEPKERFEFDGHPLGYVRSVRTIITRDGPRLIAGAQKGVYVINPAVPHERKAFQFPREPAGQGGVNAAAYFDGHVYATHSELGLFRWDIHMSVPERLFEAITTRNESTRGAQITPDGKLYFASGSDVFRADLVHADAELVAFRGKDEPITTFIVSHDELFAGTRGGRILRWSHSDPRSPRELNVRKSEPIYMLKVAEIGGEDHVLVGAKDHGLTAVSLADGRGSDYRATEQIRWVDGASDYVYGVSRSGYTIHVWEAGRLEQEAFELRVPDKLQDLWVEKERLAGAPAAT